MNEKGFTLMELLGVVIILSLLIFLVLPNITNSVNNKRENIDSLTFNMIKSATKLYIEDNSNKFKKNSSNTYCILLSTLVEEEYLMDNIEYNDEDITYKKTVQVKYNDGFKYELVDKNSCTETLAICELKEDVGADGISAGDKYSCKVDPNKEPYIFYVLSINQDNSVNLIMERNICSDGSYATSENTCLVSWYASAAVSTNGPVTAMDYLYNATTNWTNVPNIIMNYEDEDGNYGGIKTEGDKTKITKINGTTVTATYENLKARMPYYSEVSNYDGNNAYLYEYLDGSYWGYEEGQPTNNISGIYGYWTLSSYAVYSYLAWGVDYGGGVGSNYVRNGAYGVRPVITLKF